jgi:hypothetical protein
MRNSNTVFVGRLMFLAAAVITAVFAGQAYCQTGGIALLLQQTPVEGGRITPEVGVHQAGISVYLLAWRRK